MKSGFFLDRTWQDDDYWIIHHAFSFMTNLLVYISLAEDVMALKSEDFGHKRKV